ncbi:hypothetical protein CTEN210_12520 [Chaetoceros tenuissimus]|uniref:Telomere length regulation protein conserved domain-containing protein n=1 Tax=Chaetoceros tenuissimus TaxID=426638 RepID=A0AAD3HAJ8_9STRA|nr:hypothetical protein CTEN210_12520 [Chaetoceros tenuissimus]
MSEPSTKDEFLSKLEQIHHQSSKDPEKFTNSLKDLHLYLKEQRTHMDESSDKDTYIEFASFILEIHVLRIGSSLEREIQSIIDECLNVCGYNETFRAAISLLKECKLVSEKDVDRKRFILENVLYTIKRILLTEAQNEQFINVAVDIIGLKIFDRHAYTTCVDIISQLPSLISNACFEVKIQLPLWIQKAKYYSRVVYCALHNIFYANDIETSLSMEYAKCLVQKLVHLGMLEFVISGVHHFQLFVMKHESNHNQRIEDGISFISEIYTSLHSPRYVASLLCANIRHVITHQVELIGNKMGLEEVKSICTNDCIPLLEEIWLPILCRSMIRDSFLDIAILAPSLTIEVEYQKIFVMCVVLMLSKVQMEQVEYSDDSSDEEDYAKPMDTCNNNHEEVLGNCLLQVAVIWSGATFVNDVDETRQRHVTLFILYSINQLKQSKTITMTEAIQELTIGVSNRLKVLEASRVDGMFVAEAIANHLGQSLHFDELDPYREGCSGSAKLEESFEENKRATAHDKPKKKNYCRKVTQTIIDPDEEYDSCDDSSTISDSSEDSDYSSDSEWDEDEFIASSNINDDETDLHVVAKPRYLRDCLELLQANGDDHETMCKHHVAFEELPKLVRNQPPDLSDFGISLVNEVFRNENKFDIENFSHLCLDALSSLAVHDERCVAKIQEVVFAQDFSIGKRIDALQVLNHAAYELSGQLKMDETKKEPRHSSSLLPKTRRKGEAIISQNLSNLKLEQGNVEFSKSRRWRQGRPKETVSVRNTFGPRSPYFFYPLMKGFKESKDNTFLWGGENGGILLTQLINTLSNFIYASGFHPNSKVMANDLFELVWPLQFAENPQVRRSILSASLCCLPHLPEEIVVGSILSRPEVLKHLQNTSKKDGDTECRQLSTAILHGLLE